MDAFTTTIVAALKNLDKNEIKESYNSLKAALKQKPIGGIRVVTLLEKLETNPDSDKYVKIFDEEVQHFKSRLDADIIDAQNLLIDLLKKKNDYTKNTSDRSLIKKLDFGRESAETEKGFLEKVFLYTSVFERIKSGNKHLILGRKGTGKTAVCLRLYDFLDKQGVVVDLITPRNLSKFMISMLEKGSINLSESSLLSWKYVFLTIVSLHIIKEAKSLYGDNNILWPEHIRHIRKFLVRHGSE